MNDLEKLIARLKRRGVSPSIISRVSRLNDDNYTAGTIPRGLHRADTLGRRRFAEDVMGKREFISRFGRVAYEVLRHLPVACVQKHGRRVGISMIAVQGRWWEPRPAGWRWAGAE